MNILSAFGHGKALIAFITCGDPDLETTATLVRELERAGADLIELGIPFSDPTAEGPVIQQANMRALANGVTTDQIFDMTRTLRESVHVPLVFMTYANVIFSYGIARFAKTSAAAGINGVILPDVPYEEKQEFSSVFRRHGLDFISMVTPVSGERIKRIAREAEGFVYGVSSLGVTGVRADITSDIDGMVKAVRSQTQLPVAIGFGISTPEQAATISDKADGVIIGSAIVKLIGQHGRNASSPVYEFAKSVRTALDRSRQPSPLD